MVGDHLLRITWEDRCKNLADMGTEGAPIERGLGECGTDREVVATLGGTEQRRIARFLYRKLDVNVVTLL